MAPSISGPFTIKVGVVMRFNSTLKSILKRMIDQYNLDQKAWKDLLSKALYQYNYENTQRVVRKIPTEVTNRDKALFTSHKYTQTVNTQNWWNAKVNRRTESMKKNQPQHKRCHSSTPCSQCQQLFLSTHVLVPHWFLLVLPQKL